MLTELEGQEQRAVALGTVARPPKDKAFKPLIGKTKVTEVKATDAPLVRKRWEKPRPEVCKHIWAAPDEDGIIVCAVCSGERNGGGSSVSLGELRGVLN